MTIFGIGLHKTGGSSLACALDTLGYNTVHAYHDLLDSKGMSLNIKPELLGRYNAFVDIPFHLFYEELDKSIPDSKFIMTTRDTDSWVSSAQTHFSRTRHFLRRYLRGEKHNEYLVELYGSATFDHDTYVSAKEDYERSVREYFVGRDDDIMFLNVVGGEGWDTLCPFLGVPIPNSEFPCMNEKETVRNVVLSDLPLEKKLEKVILSMLRK